MMDNIRKIQPIIRKVTFADAEEADNAYWANATPVERYNELASLRMMFFGSDVIGKIEKVVRKRSLHEGTD